MNLSEDVDFDFFDTPRNEISETQSNTRGNQSSKPPKPKRVTDERFLSKHDNERHAGGDRNKVNENQGKSPYDSLSSDDSSYSDTDSETPRVKRAPAVAPAKQVVGVSNGSAARSKGRMRPDSPESSSAYSDSDSYSDDSDYNEKSRNGVPKTNISVTLPKSAEAWGEKQDTHKDRRGDEKISKHSSDPTKFRGEYRERKTSANSEDDSDSLQEHYKHKNWTGNSKNESRDRKGNAKTEKQTRKPLRSTSSSHSNNSDITDVSPLESPEVSPRENRKRYDKVQYEGKHSSEPNVDIRLDSDKIDLSILMKCMADIDREKQQRLKANSRRVMFAPPSQHDTPKSNYTFSPNRARLIEKENQRLLQQIIHHVQPGSKKLKPGTATRLVPKKATEPIVQRLTPSGLNRQREQRKIEMENLVSYLCSTGCIAGIYFLDILGRGPRAQPIGNFIGVRVKIGIFFFYIILIISFIRSKTLYE